jgi:hypothetical protein
MILEQRGSESLETGERLLGNYPLGIRQMSDSEPFLNERFRGYKFDIFG